MALTERALIGLLHAAKVAGVDLATYQESVLEADGQHFAQFADEAAVAKKLEAFDKADPKATKGQILAEAAKVEIEVTEDVK